MLIMTHELSTLLANSFYCLSIICWIGLAMLLFWGLLKEDVELIKRAVKYLINSVVFFVVYVFYMTFAIYDKPPVPTAQLKEWANGILLQQLLISGFVAVILLVVNFMFYRKLESPQRRAKLGLLFVGDALVMAGGAWVASQDGYLGLLEEAARSL
jgi:prolipoprotein diacylglyceryltransferase